MDLDLIILDVNETLFSLEPVADRLDDAGLAGQLEVWFARILRDGFAAAAADAFASFPELARHHLAVLLRDHDRAASQEQLDEVLGAFRRFVPTPMSSQGCSGSVRLG